MSTVKICKVIEQLKEHGGLSIILLIIQYCLVCYIYINLQVK